MKKTTARKVGLSCSVDGEFDLLVGKSLWDLAHDVKDELRRALATVVLRYRLKPEVFEISCDCKQDDGLCPHGIDEDEGPRCIECTAETSYAEYIAAEGYDE